jgi:hypothetical protein
MKCPICEVRPVNGNGKYCGTCFDTMARQKAKTTVRPKKYLTYQGYVVGLVPNSGDGRLYPILLKRDPTKLPKKTTLDLNTYLTGYNRTQIKAFKRCVLQTAHA